MWIVGKEYRTKTYYVKEIDKNNKAVIWTSNINKAMALRTESRVNHFIHAYLKNRKDIRIHQHVLISPGE